MPLYSFEGKAPRIHPDAFVAPTATIVGDVEIEAGASVWYGVVIRADYSPVIIRTGANVQDNSVIHGGPGAHTEIGPGATVAHLCVIHSAMLGAECMVANGCTVLDGASVGSRALVAAHSLVSAGQFVPEGFLVAGAPAEVKRPVEGSPAEMWVRMNPPAYAELAQRHLRGTKPV